MEQLGAGSFGVVWKALDTQLDRFAAVKIPRSDQLDEAGVEKFFREARAAAQLHHSNIVAVHEVGRDGNTIFIASDYVEGSTLKEWLGGQPLPPREAAKLCATISEALHVAHEAGVIHRDLKPQNIMMDVDGLPHVEPGQPDLRGFEWYYFWRQMNGFLCSFNSSSSFGNLEMAVISPDGNTVAALSDAGRLCVWDIPTYTTVFSVRAHMHGTNTRELFRCAFVAFSPDGRVLATGGARGDVKLWDTGSWKCLAHFKDMKLPVTCVAFTDQTGAVSIWDTQTWRHVDGLRGHTTAVISIAASRDETRLVTGSIDGKIKVWDATRQYAPQRFSDFGDSVVSLAFSPDGELVASGDRAGYAKIWRRGSGAQVASFEPGGWVNAVAFHPQRKILATTCTHVPEEVRVWDYATGQQIIELGKHAGGRTVAFSPDGKLLAAGGWSGSPHMHVWDTEHWNRTDHFIDQKYNFGVHAVAFSPDGATLAAGCSDNKVRFIKPGQGPMPKLLEHNFPIVSLAYSADGSLLAAGGYPGNNPTVRVWSVETGKVVADLAGHMFCAWGLAFSPAGDTLATGSGYGQVYLWDTETWEARARYKTDTPRYVFAIAFSPDGRTLACTNCQADQRGGFILLQADESMPSALGK